MTDRAHWLDGPAVGLNIRRLMYQTLIWAAVLGNEAGGLASALDSEDVEGAADALVDGVRRDVQLGRDFLGGEMLIDEPETIELAGTQPRDPARQH